MRMIAVLLFTSLLALSGCAEKQETAMEHEHGPKVKKHFEGSMAKLSDNGKFSVELVIPEKELRMGVNVVEVIVHHGTGGGDVAGAAVSIVPWMPSMGHGVMTKPTVTERGGGLYSINDVVLSMTGHWQLKIEIVKDAVTDNVTFEFPEVKAMGHEHAAMHAPPPSNLDLSTTQVSEKDHFTVSYKSVRDPIMINKIHSWSLDVKGSDGKPVDNAKITIVGDMPEHGHGFPTNPEVVKGSGPGNYLVEGVKFSMPGWWVVTFNIMADGKMDNVTFNLQMR